MFPVNFFFLYLFFRKKKKGLREIICRIILNDQHKEENVKMVELEVKNKFLKEDV